MKRKQTRYTSEAQILKAIDKYNQKAIELLAQSEEADRNAHELLKYNSMSEVGKYELAMSKKLKRSSARIMDKKLPQLKNALAAFRTELMPFTQDRGVVLQ